MATKYTVYVFDKVAGQFVKTSATQYGDGMSYDIFVDAPIKNAHGASDDTCVNFSALKEGTYSVTGYYRLDTSTPVKTAGKLPMTVLVTKDTVSGERTVKYETIEDGKTHVHVVTYANDTIAEDTVVPADKAAGISVQDSGNLFAADNVEDALTEIAGGIATAKDEASIYITHNNNSQLYEIYQGGRDAEHKVGEINIPQDMVATSGSLYTATAQDTGLTEGELYIRMQVSNGQPFYIPVKGLIDVYTGTNTATGIAITVENNVISATIKTLDGSKLDQKSVRLEALEQSVQNSLANADTAVQEISEGEANGTINVDGSDVKIHGLGTAAYSNSDAYETAGAASAVKAELLGNASTDTDASKTIEGLLKKLSTVIQSLDSSAVIASKTGDAVTIRSGITQNDGVVDNDGNADIVLANVAATGNATDISIRDDGNIITAQNLEGALQEIMGNINTIIDQLTWKDI